MRKGFCSFLLLLLGIGSETKVFFLGTIALSELAIFPLAPLIFLKDYAQLRKEGFLLFVNMLFFVCLGMFASAWYNHTPFPHVLKSFAVMYAVFAYFVVFHKLLRGNLRGLTWFVIGAAISTVITIFGFNPQTQFTDQGSVYIGTSAIESFAATFSSPLFWAHRLFAVAKIPIAAIYLRIPSLISLFLPIAYSGFVVLHSVSGRSAAITFMLAGVMMLIGGRTRLKMQRIGRHLLLGMFCCLIGLFLLKVVYSFAAKNGLMGEDAQNKYEHQTRKGESTMKLLMAGREEFFIALTAVVDQPLIGFGPHAVDTGGYYENFIRKHGDELDDGYLQAMHKNEMLFGYTHKIPTHSHILGAWVHYGLPGLIFYLWAIVIIYQHLRYYISAIPQWFGYIALFVAKYAWDFLFSGFWSRSEFALFFACLFFARAIGQGRMMLPYEMEMEARKYDHG